MGTDRWLGNRDKQGIQSGDLIQSDRNPLQFRLPHLPRGQT
jgi:hypothetical protein